MTVSEDTEPRYVISIAASILGIKTHTLRYYEKIGIIRPSRSRGNIRLYSDKDIVQLRRVKTLMDDMGVNMAGVEVILRISELMIQLHNRVKELEDELERSK